MDISADLRLFVDAGIGSVRLWVCGPDGAVADGAVYPGGMELRQALAAWAGHPALSAGRC